MKRPRWQAFLKEMRPSAGCATPGRDGMGRGRASGTSVHVRQHNRCAKLMFVAPKAVSGINGQSVGSRNIRRRLRNASCSNPHLAATTIGNVLAQPHPGGSPIATQGVRGASSTLESPSISGVVVRAARERTRCELPVVPLVMSAVMPKLSCGVAHSLLHWSMLASGQLVHQLAPQQRV